MGNMVWLVIASCSRGLVIWLLTHLGSEHYMLDLSDKDKVTWHFPVNTSMYQLKIHKATWIEGVGLVFKVNETRPLLQHILISHKKIDSKSHLGDLHVDAGTGVDTSKMTMKDAREALIKHVFSR